MKRIVEREWLDELPKDDPRAIGSRRDLQRLNFLMGNVGIIERNLVKSFPNQSPKRIVEFGAGDGTFMLELTKRLSVRWKNVEMTLVDLQNVVSLETRESISKLGWKLEIVEANVFDWLLDCAPTDCIIANLFLHHFEAEKLSLLLRQSAEKTKAFIACEPRRDAMGVLGTQFLWAIGCNDVTRHDAPASVRAGFRTNDLSMLWPQHAKWKIKESETGLFSHVFVAEQISIE